MLRVGGRVEHDQAQLGVVREVLLLQYEVPQDGPDQVPLGAHHGGVLQDDDIAGRLVSAHTQPRGSEVQSGQVLTESKVRV